MSEKVTSEECNCILYEECALLLECFQNNKIPWNDGIPIEFYQNFCPLLVNLLFHVPTNALKKAKCHAHKNKQS